MPKERKNSRAANGSGSISKRTRIDEKSGKKRIWWEAKVTVGYRSDGKPVRRTVTGSSQAEARAKMLELLEAVENKTYVDQNDLTLSEWLQTWLENYQIKGEGRALEINRLLTTLRSIQPTTAFDQDRDNYRMKTSGTGRTRSKCEKTFLSGRKLILPWRKRLRSATSESIGCGRSATIKTARLYYGWGASD